MKKLIVCLTLACLASLPVARAGEGKSATKAASADKAKVTSSAKTTCSEKTGCSGIEVSSSAKTACTEKSSCCENEKVARKVAKPDEKGATFLVKR
jgi:hypothetical protein